MTAGHILNSGMTVYTPIGIPPTLHSWCHETWVTISPTLGKSAEVHLTVCQL